MYKVRTLAQMGDLIWPLESLWLNYASDLFAICISTMLNNKQYVLYYQFQ